MAVYTEVTADDINAFLQDYDVGNAVTFKGIAEGVENSNYLLQTEKGHFILTLYEKRVKAEDLPFFIGLMDHLAAKGIRCPEPVHDRQGRALKPLCHRTAAMVTFLPGISLRHASPAQTGEVGAALANMQLAAADFDGVRPNALGHDGWRKLAERCGARADEIAPGLAGLIADELGFLDRNWPTGLPEGVIHADLFPDNVFFLGDRLSGLIDFYFACNDLWAYDLAICINAWCFEADGAFNVTKTRRMLEGYRSMRRLETGEVDALPILCRAAALRFLLTRTHDWLHRVEGALVRPHDPTPFLNRLRFHRSIDSADAYGLEREQLL